MRNEKFAEFIRWVGGKKKAAEALGLSIYTVEAIRKGARRVNPTVANRIHTLTFGNITRESLVWPD